MKTSRLWRALPVTYCLLWLVALVCLAAPAPTTWADSVEASAAALTPLDSPEGRVLLRAAGEHEDLISLLRYHDGQQNPTFCGVASGVAVLNALHFEGPTVGNPLTGSYPFFTQPGFFTPEASEVRSALAVRTGGMTLAQLADLLRAHGAAVELRFADSQPPPNSDLKATTEPIPTGAAGKIEAAAAALRSDLLKDLGSTDRYLIANYHRPTLGQAGGGHISPLVAYAPQADQVLILDVANYRYPPVWVPVAALAAAMVAVDPSSERSRGWLVVGR